MAGTGLELILNNAEGALQICLTENGSTLCFQEWFVSNRGTEILAPAIAQIRDSLRISLSALRRIACVTGPGSFTGIRLVLATAAALRRGTGAMLGSLDYMQALATTAAVARGLLYPSRIIVLTHARRKLVHYQAFISYGPQIPAQPVAPVELISPGEALCRLAADPCHACGSGLARYPEYFALPITGQGPVGAPDAVLLPEIHNPSCTALCLLARHGDYFPKDLVPLYVRPCDAVENLGSAPAGEESLQRLTKLLGRDPVQKDPC